MKPSSIEERIDAVFQGLTLMVLALGADPDRAGLDRYDVDEALLPLAKELREEAFWIKTHLPANARAQPAAGMEP